MAADTAAKEVNQDLWILATAHPDDESMFFLPTLRNLLTNSGSTQKGDQSAAAQAAALHILCLSNGDYNDSSDGPIRTKELYKACKIIGISNSLVIDDDRLKDGPNEVWDADLIASKVMDYAKDAILSSKDDKDKDSWKYIDEEQASDDEETVINLNLLTFDNRGVSSHPNHIDTFKGIQHLLQERAINRRDTSNDTIHSHLILSNWKAKIKINLFVLTLRTISNPFHKYFLWAIVELPQLAVLLLQMIWSLIFFLSGGRMWADSSRKQQQPISYCGKRTTSSTTQYRIMEPVLVWKAMAAHHSQFVWYRRLSVLFSRYTFINDLVGLDPDESYLSLQDEYAQLPPVNVIQEEESKFLLSQQQMNTLREHILPPSIQIRPWKRIYSLARDGDSFVAFQKLVGEWNKTRFGHNTILVVKTNARELIGGYADVPFLETKQQPSGAGAGTCLFKLVGEEIIVYGKGNGGVKRVVFDATRRFIAFGGGASDGSQDDGFGLSLEDGFLRGTTAHCQAFGNEPLVSGDVFEVIDVEVWGFVYGQL